MSASKISANAEYQWIHMQAMPPDEYNHKEKEYRKQRRKIRRKKKRKDENKKKKTKIKAKENAQRELLESETKQGKRRTK